MHKNKEIIHYVKIQYIQTEFIKLPIKIYKYHKM